MKTPTFNLGSPLQRMGAPPGANTKEDLRANSIEAEGDSPPIFEKVLERQTEAPKVKESPREGVKVAEPRIEDRGREPLREQRVESPLSKNTEAKPIKEKDQVDSPEKKQEQAQVLMLNFMDSMESELGIAPAEIVDAMSGLSKQALMLPPEETVDQVIGKLNLDDNDEDIAIDLYTDLLAGLAFVKGEPQMTSAWASGAWANSQMQAAVGAGALGAGIGMSQSQAPLGNANFPSVPVPGADLPQQSLAPKTRRELLNDSLDRMNSKFFLNDKNVVDKGTVVADSSKLGLEGKLQGSNEAPLMNPKSIDQMSFANQDGKMAIPEGMTAVDPTLAPQTFDIDPSSMTPQKMDPNVNAYSKAKMSTPMEFRQSMDPNLVATTAGLAAQAMKAMPKAMAKGEAALLESPKIQNVEGLSTFNADQMSVVGNGDLLPNVNAQSAGSENSNLFSDSEQSDEIDMSGDSSGKIAGDKFAVPKEASSKNLTATVAGAAGAALGAKNNQADPNIQAIMNRAQILIRDGGGEMKVTMTPEGMGKVDLKVAVENGKVNVEMVADSPQTKKLIESASNDLKSHLAESKLDVGSIKVDLASKSSLNSDNSPSQQQQKQMDTAADQRGRDQAQQFFNQFRDGNNSARGGLTELPDFRSYRSQKNVTMEPQKLPEKRTNENGRISLIA